MLRWRPDYGHQAAAAIPAACGPIYGSGGFQRREASPAGMLLVSLRHSRHRAVATTPRTANIPVDDKSLVIIP